MGLPKEANPSPKEVTTLGWDNPIPTGTTQRLNLVSLSLPLLEVLESCPDFPRLNPDLGRFGWWIVGCPDLGQL